MTLGGGDPLGAALGARAAIVLRASLCSANARRYLTCSALGLGLRAESYFSSQARAAACASARPFRSLAE